MKVRVNSELSWFKPDKKRIKRLIELTLQRMGVDIDGWVEVNFISRDEIQRINRDFFNEDGPTDVISFGYLDGEPVAGDDIAAELLISPEVAMENSKVFGTSFGEELDQLVVHGMLHVLGLDHEKKDEEELMFGIQAEVLSDFEDEQAGWGDSD